MRTMLIIMLTILPFSKHLHSFPLGASTPAESVPRVAVTYLRVY